MKIAVLVPVYNAEKYLRECLDSLLANAADLPPSSSLSVFCLNDGSKDGSQAILNEYAARHANVQVAQQENAGVSLTRNRLMDALPAEYDAFAFCDSDDTVACGMYAKLAEAMARTGAGVAETEWDGPETVMDDMRVFLLKRTAPNRHWINVINKLYRREAVGQIRFHEGLKFEEDLYFNFEVHQAIRRKVLVPGRFYYYRPNPASATSVLNLRDYFDSCSRRIRLSCEEFLKAGRIPADIEPAFRAELAKDAYRMCIRKNLKKNRDAALRRELFFWAHDFLKGICGEYQLDASGLNLVQRRVFASCLKGQYHLARLATLFT